MSAAQAQKVADIQRIEARADLVNMTSEKQEADVRLEKEEVEGEEGEMIIEYQKSYLVVTSEVGLGSSGYR